MKHYQYGKLIKKERRVFYIPDLWKLYLEDMLKLDKELKNDVYTQGKTPESDGQLKIFGEYNEIENKNFKKKNLSRFYLFR